ncbi:YtxH domain-containing protein [Parachryseolinea silvisoli]|jgi:gas vesicle protein|uniref:YtxH domain-containing protein n=1 Tax=Parachryseolinea silvisoli TaxID=2873601 RepID=UPI002265B75E|nr:YtxH domain-containing protein [Parachryseolinea silvisoli]MCD9015133.1 YtxH domain-containing protein [Parachryseolinea silvisoli]
MKKEKAILAVLAGVAAGAVLGVLFAPDEGRYTRKRIIRKGGDLADALNDTIDEKFSDLCTAVTAQVKNALAHNDSPMREKQFTE